MLGTNPYPFTRLIDKVIEWAEKTEESVIIQSGNTPVDSDQVKSYPFMEHSKIMALIADADVVITQGGFGSLQDCMESAAKTVAVPRLIEMGESQDDQTEIVNALAEEGLVIPLYNVDELGVAIDAALNLESSSTKDDALPQHIASTIKGILGH